MSTVEIARLAGVSRQYIDRLSRGTDFPAPAASLAIGRVWLGEDIETWLIRTGRSQERST